MPWQFQVPFRFQFWTQDSPNTLPIIISHVSAKRWFYPISKRFWLLILQRVKRFCCEKKNHFATVKMIFPRQLCLQFESFIQYNSCKTKKNSLLFFSQKLDTNLDSTPTASCAFAKFHHVFRSLKKREKKIVIYCTVSLTWKIFLSLSLEWHWQNNEIIVIKILAQHSPKNFVNWVLQLLTFPEVFCVSRIDIQPLTHGVQSIALTARL